MRPRILVTILLTALFVILSGCGTTPNCPTCGTTINGAYAIIDVVPVPEHNSAGEPGGPFNSFDISWIAGPPSGGLSGTHNLDYISDRIGLVVQVIDTTEDLAMFSIQGSNAVSGAGNGASPCAKDPVTGFDLIPPIIDVFGNFTRYGCRSDMSTATPPGPTFHLITGFGANHNFGGFPGAQCCASRGNGVNPMSGPDGREVSADGNTLFVGNGSASVAVFDLTAMNLGSQTPPTVLADIPTGVSADYDGPQGISGCVASWNGEAGSATDCGDDRADEMSFDNVHKVLAIINGDPGLPFITFIDMSHVVGKTGTPAQQHCAPIDATLAYGPYPPGYSAATYPLQGSGTGVPPSIQLDPGNGGSFNPPSCILGQIYYDGAGGGASGGIGLTNTVAVDTVGGTFPCPDPSNPHVFSGVSGSAAADGPLGLLGIGTTPSGVSYTIPCHHGPILDQNLGVFCSQTAPGSTCAGAISPAGLGGMVWDPNSGFLLLSNGNSVGNINIGSIDVIDPRLTDTSCPGGVSCGPVVVDSIVTPNCMPTGVAHGPGNNFLVGCADHDGKSFPASEYIITYTPGANIVCAMPPAPTENCVPITNVGGVDEVWYNPGDNRYYLAARDMFPSAVMGVIDAKTNQWLYNMPTNSNSHSISVDPNNNHAFVPLQSGAVCSTLNSYGCVGVATEQ